MKKIITASAWLTYRQPIPLAGSAGVIEYGGGKGFPQIMQGIFVTYFLI